MEPGVGFSRKQWIFLWSLPVLFLLVIIASLVGKHILAHVPHSALHVMHRHNRKAVKLKMPNAYLLSNTGDSEWNGLYLQDGTANGYPAYSKDSDHWMFWGIDDGQWKLWSAKLDGEGNDGTIGAYSGGTNPSDPTDGTWHSYIGETSEPGPTITLAVPAYTASDFGDDDFNGDYFEYDLNGLSFVNITSRYFLLFYSGHWTLGYSTNNDGVYRGGSNESDPTDGAWSVTGGTSPAGVVISNLPDTTAPTIDAATVSAATPNKISLTTTEADSPPITGTSGLSLSGLLHGAATLSNYVITSGNIAADISRNLYSDEQAVKLNYTPGNLADSADTPNAMAAFSNLAVTNNSTEEYVPMAITFTITPGANKALAIPTSADEDVTIAQTQMGSNGTIPIPARVPMLNKNVSTRMAADIDGLDAASPLDKAMMINFDLSALVNPIWFFDENEETYQSHVDGEEPQRKIGLRLSKSSSDLAALQALRTAQPATPKWYQMRLVHADDSKYSLKSEIFASPNAAITLGAGNNVRYVEFPMVTMISGKGFAMRFKHTMPSA